MKNKIVLIACLLSVGGVYAESGREVAVETAGLVAGVGVAAGVLRFARDTHYHNKQAEVVAERLSQTNINAKERAELLEKQAFHQNKRRLGMRAVRRALEVMGKGAGIVAGLWALYKLLLYAGVDKSNIFAGAVMVEIFAPIVGVAVFSGFLLKRLIERRALRRARQDVAAEYAAE